MAVVRDAGIISVNHRRERMLSEGQRSAIVIGYFDVILFANIPREPMQVVKDIVRELTRSEDDIVGNLDDLAGTVE